MFAGDKRNDIIRVMKLTISAMSEESSNFFQRSE